MALEVPGVAELAGKRDQVKEQIKWHVETIVETCLAIANINTGFVDKVDCLSTIYKVAMKIASLEVKSGDLLSDIHSLEAEVP